MMNVSLTEELEKLVLNKVRSGMYNNASEVIREALRLLKERDDDRQEKLQSLRAEIHKGMKSLDAGQGIPGAKAFEKVRTGLIKSQGKKR